jgi:hypothetical protein
MKNILLIIKCVLLANCLHSVTLSAQDHPLHGTWKWKKTNNDGNPESGYTWVYKDAEVGINRITSVTVDPTTHEPVSVWNIYQLPTTNNIGNRLWTGSDGAYGIANELFKENSSKVIFSGVTTNGIASGSIHNAWNTTVDKKESWTEDVVVGGKFFGQLSSPEESEKIDYKPVEVGELIINRSKMPILDDRFNDLIGKWESYNEAGVRNLEIEFQKWDLGNCLLEKWVFYNEAGEVNEAGFNISKKNPNTGEIIIWSVNRNGIAQTGGWDFIDPFTLGQRQGEGRLVRRFISENKIHARWQSKINGDYKYNGQGYILTKVEPEADSDILENEDTQYRSYFKRASEAKKFTGFVKLDYKIVKDEDIPAYLEAESKWKMLHEQRMQKGILHLWQLNKLSNHKDGEPNFATVQVYGSYEDMQDSESWNNLDLALVGDRQELWQKTKQLFQDAGSDTYHIVDQVWEENASIINVDLIEHGHMKPLNGLTQQYVNAELNIAKPFWNLVISLDNNIKGWGLHKLVSSTREKVNHEFMTAHFKDTTSENVNETFAEIAQKGIQMLREPNMDWNALRIMERGPSYQIVLRADRKHNPVEQEWKKLTGVWRADMENGSYRIKRISLNTEQLEVYNAESQLMWKVVCPMKLEVKNGLTHFYSYHANGTYHSIYKVAENKWYEQRRGVWYNGNGEPNQFIVYDKISM